MARDKEQAGNAAEGAQNEQAAAKASSNVVDERVVSGQRVQVIEQEASNEPVAPSPGSDRTPGEPTPSEGGDGGVVTFAVSPDQAAAMKLLLDQMSFAGGPAGIAALMEQQRVAAAQDKASRESSDEALKKHEQRMKELGITLQSAMTPEIALREMRNRDKLEARAMKMDTSDTPGGKYLLSDGKTYVNANGDVIEG